MARLAQAIQLSDGFDFGLRVGQSLQAASIGLPSDLRIAPREAVGRPFAQRLPPAGLYRDPAVLISTKRAAP